MREFNITGTCIPEKHYMVDICDKLDYILNLVENEKYFVINRPRQYGKTTTLYQIRRILSSKYVVISISFEGYGNSVFSSETLFVNEFINAVKKSLIINKANNELIESWQKIDGSISPMTNLSQNITSLVNSSDREIILMIDEVDKSSGNQIFIDFLGMLRTKYLSRNEGTDATFKSVILASVHDVKNLRLKIRTDEDHKFNSPWNIAAPFDIDMSFSPEEISTMLTQYENDHNTGMDMDKVSNGLYYFTNGYPFLVSYICKIIDEKLSKEWNSDGIDKAVKIFLGEKTTLTDSLIKNIENDKELYDLVYTLLVTLDPIDYISSNSTIEKGVMYGIISKGNNNKVVISNKIFELYIYNHLMSKKKLSRNIGNTDDMERKYVSDGKLNMSKILDGFKNFMHSEYRNKDENFIEREGRLLFLAFLKPIINGSGFYYVEAETGEDKRMDVIVTYGKEEFIIELKIWRGASEHERALDQLTDYLNLMNHDVGYLLTFSFNKHKDTASSWAIHSDKKIYNVVV